MKHPFKIIGLLIIVAAIVYAAWPTDTVREHDPISGEGAPGDSHNHGHLESPTLPLEKNPGNQNTGE